MRHQERNVSEFDEIITYPPSAAPSGEKQVMSCVQAFTAALGFAMSAGWDWLPSMHTLWLRDYIEAVSMPTPFGFFGTLSGSIFFKMIMLLALCPVMERLFHAFPLDRVAFRRKPFPNADYALLPPALRERIYLSTPLILAAARSLERHLLWPGNHVQHPYFPAFGYGPGRVAGPFQDAVSHSGDPVDILRHAAFRRHPEAYPAPPPPMPVLDSGQGRPLARAFAAPPFLSGYSLQAGKRLSGSVRVPNYVWCSDFT